jgi:hypothetical protein
MRSRYWIAILLTVSASWHTLTLAQGIAGRAAEDAIHELAPKLESVIHDANRSLSEVASRELAEKTARELQRTVRDYVVSGDETSAAKGFHATVDQHYAQIRASTLSMGELSPEAIYKGLEATNQKRYIWNRQEYERQGDTLVVKPAWLESGVANVSLPKLRGFYVKASSSRPRFDPNSPFTVR